ncbi:MAG: transporter substrate-binding domain-containing protein [Acetobacteraceae bacterium]
MTQRRGWLALPLALVLSLAPAVARAQVPFMTGIDATAAPHAMPKLGGGIQGFQVDLFNEVARRLDRGIVFAPARFADLLPALHDGRYDFLAAPVTVTPERAEVLLFTQGYLWTSCRFGLRQGAPPVQDWADLAGKAVAVVAGTACADLAGTSAEANGFTVQAFNAGFDAVRAVVSGTADAALAADTVIRYAERTNPMFAAGMVLPDTRAPWAAPFRTDSAALRGQVDDVLKCMKQDGTVAKLSEKWFGVAPTPDDLQRLVLPGHGIPGLPGYDPDAPDPDCSQYR